MATKVADQSSADSVVSMAEHSVVSQAFERFAEHGGAAELVDTLLAYPGPWTASGLSLISLELRGPDGELRLAPDENLRLWSGLGARTSLVAARAGRADALARAGRADEALVGYLDVFGDEPLLLVDLFDEVVPLATALGGDLEFEFWLASLRSSLAAAAEGDGPDDLRERYAELLEQYGADPNAVARLRIIGQQMTVLEEAGTLPRAFLRRGRSRNGETT